MEYVCIRCLERHDDSIDDCPYPVIELVSSLPLGEPKNPKLSPVRASISKLLQCPINWEEIAPGYEIVSCMEDYWRYVATSCQSKGTEDWESFYNGDFVNEVVVMNKLDEVGGQIFYTYFSSILLEIEDEEILEKELPQIEAWICKAKAVYEDRTNRFKKMRMANEDTYRKHFPLPNVPTEEIRRRSGTGEQISYFYKGVTPERLQGLLWDVLGECWEALLFIPKAKLYVDAGMTVGASKGEDTNYIFLDVDLSTPQTHAYPIRKADIPNNEIVMSSTCLRDRY